MQIPGYHIEREIGRGGMSIVYLAVQESLNRPVALKIMSPVLATDPQFAKRFVKEGVTVARLAHRGIIKVFDTGVYENHYYLSMEYLPGGTLADRIKQGLPLKEGLAILGAVAEALGHAHQAGVVHRDVKPQNILFYGDGAPVVTDFGIAKTFGNATVMTATGLMMGSPNYMSPEQIKGMGVDSKSDLYALGIIFHEILTGQTPYNAPDSFALAIQHLNSPIPQLPARLAHFQPVLEQLLAKEAGQRVAGAEQFIAALEQAGRRAGARSGTVGEAGRGGGGLGLAAALALALLAGGGGAWWYYGQPVTAAEPSAAAAQAPAAPPEPQPPDITGLLVIARGQLDAGHPGPALERLEQALAQVPDDPEARALQQQAEQALGKQRRQAELEAEQQRLAELASRRQAQAQDQRRSEAEQQLAEQRRRDEAEQRRRELALEYQRLEEERRHLAEERRRLEAEHDRRQATSLAMEARSALEAGDPDTALERLERALARVPDHAESLELRHRALAEQREAERRRLEAERRRLAEQERRQHQEQLAAPETDLSQDQRRRVQLALTSLGYDTQGIDGLFGGNTRKAIDAYQQARGLPRTGYLDAAQTRELLGIAEQAMGQAATRPIPEPLALAAPQPVAPQPVAPQPVAPQPVAPQPAATPDSEPEPEPEFVPVTAGESGGVRRRIVSRTVTTLEAPPPKLVAVEQPLLPASADQPMTAAELSRLDDCWAQRSGQPVPSASILCIRQGQARVRVEEQGGVCQSYGPVQIAGLNLEFTAQSSASSPACRVTTVRFHCTHIRQITMSCTVELHYPAGAYAGASPRRDTLRFVRAVNAAASR